MNRRHLLLGAVAAGGLVAGTGGAGLLRLHRNPRRRPFLTDAHLAGIRAEDLPRPRVLFVGNSMTLRHDLPARVADRAAGEGITLSVAMAAAGGARLIETWRIDAFRDLLARMAWDAVVLQDFTKTPLRGIDRMGSALAAERIAARVSPAPVVLYPPPPPAAGNSVYRDAGFLTATPRDPEDYADRTTRHYARLATLTDGVPAPVPGRWLTETADGLHAPDGHHLSAAGADLVAKSLWWTMRGVLEL